MNGTCVTSGSSSLSTVRVRISRLFGSHFSRMGDVALVMITVNNNTKKDGEHVNSLFISCTKANLLINLILTIIYHPALLHCRGRCSCFTHSKIEKMKKMLMMMKMWKNEGACLKGDVINVLRDSDGVLTVYAAFTAAHGELQY